MAQEQENLDLGAMLDGTLDDIPDAPEFVTPPAGEYNLMVKDCKIEAYKQKDGTASQRIRVIYAINSTSQVTGQEQPVPDNSMFSETFTGTVKGLSFFKTRAKAILQISDSANVSFGSMLNAIKGVSFNAWLTIRRTPNPKGGEYENVQIRVLPSSAGLFPFIRKSGD